MTLSDASDHHAASLQVVPSSEMIVISRSKALSAAVVSWACLTSTQGAAYVLLDVACMGERNDGVCQGEEEWTRIVATDGSRPDAFYAPQDPRYQELYKRLGIHADNVQLKGVF